MLSESYIHAWPQTLKVEAGLPRICLFGTIEGEGIQCFQSLADQSYCN